MAEQSLARESPAVSRTAVYGHLRLSTRKLEAGNHLEATVEITNSGKLAGDEVAEAYLIPPASGNGGLSPKLQLVGYQRVHLQPAESRTVTFDLEPRWISEVDTEGNRSAQAGSYKLAIGGAQPNDSKATTSALTESFEIVGHQDLPR